PKRPRDEQEGSHCPVAVRVSSSSLRARWGAAAALLSALALLCSLRQSAAAAPPAKPSAAETAFFENKIRPLLAQNCYKCHSAEATKVKGELLLDSRAGLSKGGQSGPVVVPGEPEKSLLIKAVRYTDPDLQMPPKGEKLSDAQIAD